MLVLLKVAMYKKGVDTEEKKRYVAWKLEQHRQQHPGTRIVFIYDFTDAGITNMARTVTTNVTQLDNRKFKIIIADFSRQNIQ